MGSEHRWRRISSETLYTGGPENGFRLTVDQARRPDGATVAYPHIVTPHSVRILAVHRGRIPLVTQHHYLHGTEITDLPGGIVNDGELPEAAARRELAEETGLTASWTHPLGVVATARAAATERVHLFLAHGCTPGLEHPDAGEAINTQWRTWGELAEVDITTVQHEFQHLADAASLAAVQRTAALMRLVGGHHLPSSSDHLTASAWAAYTAVEGRDPWVDDQLGLVWLDLACGRFAEGAVIVADLAAARTSLDAETAWERAGQRLLSLARADK
ncbi:NUDIX hydrolase [Streptomyces xylophagus]|uniref:NUDIX hydrolase n=1 Tax=Streptomyces xylophagus TaxID=285514 RepID=UPI0005B83AE3|nr:NUDIX hydrolase [Streptomyces xylophagus]